MIWVLRFSLHMIWLLSRKGVSVEKKKKKVIGCNILDIEGGASDNRFKIVFSSQNCVDVILLKGVFVGK